MLSRRPDTALAQLDLQIGHPFSGDLVPVSQTVGVAPPSMRYVVPVMKPLKGLATKQTAAARSLGCPSRVPARAPVSSNASANAYTVHDNILADSDRRFCPLLGSLGPKLGQARAAEAFQVVLP